MGNSLLSKRTAARAQALELLFQAEATSRFVSEVLASDYALSAGPLDDYAAELALGADRHGAEFDHKLNEVSANWRVSRMNPVDRNLLRLALYEIFYCDDVDVAVTINECVDLAKLYSGEEDARFINGLLGKIVRGEELAEVDEALQDVSGELDAEIADDVVSEVTAEVIDADLRGELDA